MIRTSYGIKRMKRTIYQLIRHGFPSQSHQSFKDITSRAIGSNARATMSPSELSEISDGAMAALEQDLIARVDNQVLFSRINTGLNTGSINSAAILDIVKKLYATGAIVPVSFMLDAGLLLFIRSNCCMLIQ